MKHLTKTFHAKVSLGQGEIPVTNYQCFSPEQFRLKSFWLALDVREADGMPKVAVGGQAALPAGANKAKRPVGNLEIVGRGLLFLLHVTAVRMGRAAPVLEQTQFLSSL